ncbi:MAG: DUF262 domain-containing protein [Prevotella sp.]|nr:DUF262 domain-containing protein [Prevotella sp.]
MNTIHLKNCTLRELLESPLRIPEYQRSYEWNSYHVRNLLGDTLKTYRHGQKPYLLGTVILHASSGQQQLDIVDGQQRLITLSILLGALGGTQSRLMEAEFDNVRSFYYIKNTQAEVQSFLNSQRLHHDASYSDYLYSHLHFAVLTIEGPDALDLSYTFFNSLNSKGRSLSDYDLLKAHHLMFIPTEQESLARKHNDFWVGANHRHQRVFGELLRRIRMWGRGERRDNNRERNNYYEFLTAVEPTEREMREHLLNRYMQPDAFRSWYREDDRIVLTQKFPAADAEQLVPVEITQLIEGGDAFFVYARRYHALYGQLFHPSEHSGTAVGYVAELARQMKNDYLRQAFRAAMLLYYDKFGEQQLIEMASCVEMILSERRFVWGNNWPRNIYVESVLDLVKDKNIIMNILNATTVSQALHQLARQINCGPRQISRNEWTSPALSRYFGSMQQFYQANAAKIRDRGIYDKVNIIYQLEQQ